MANEKVTQLPTVVSAATADIIYAVQGGTSVQETLSQVLALGLSQTILSYPGNPNGNLAGNTYQLCWDTTDQLLYICTTSGSSTTAVWTKAGSIPIPLPLSEGGTGAVLTASNGGIFYSTASAGAILSGTATARQMLQSGSSSAPSWSTSTWPATTTINQILYSSSANTVNGIASANSAMLYTNSSGVPAMSSSMTDGQLMIGATSGSPTPANLTAGPGVSISNSANTITISGTASSIGWTHVTGTSQTMVAENGYVADNAGLVTLTLPTTATFGSALAVIGKGVGGWLIAQNNGQNIQIGNVSSTGGATGSVSSTNNFDSLYLVCTVANTTWTCLGAPQGTLTIA